MNELDQFVKHWLKIKYYYRYTDDFIRLSTSKEELMDWKNKVEVFLRDELGLRIHPKKVAIRKNTQGIDFLGYVVFPHHILVRNKTKKRMLKKLRNKVQEFEEGVIEKEVLLNSMDSYLGVLKHAKGFKTKKEVRHLIRRVDDKMMI